MDLQEDMYYRKYLKYKQKYLQSRAELEGGVNWESLHPLNWFKTKPKTDAEAKAKAQAKAQAEKKKLIKVIQEINDPIKIQLIHTYIDEGLKTALPAHVIDRRAVAKKEANAAEEKAEKAEIVNNIKTCNCKGDRGDHFSISIHDYFIIMKIFKKLSEIEEIYTGQYDTKYQHHKTKLHKMVVALDDLINTKHERDGGQFHIIQFLINILYQPDIRAIINRNRNICSFLDRDLEIKEKETFTTIFNYLFYKKLNIKKICVDPKKNEEMPHTDIIKNILGTTSEYLVDLVINFGDKISEGKLIL
jgi:hypothetical protein